MKKILFPIIAAAVASPTLADQTIRGTITDAHSKEPLGGVYVQAFGSNKFSTMTDENGAYEINVPDYCASLRILCDGYQSQQLPLQGRSSDVNTSLWPATFTGNIGLEETSLQSLAVQTSDITADVSIDTQIASSLGGQIRAINRGGVPGNGAFMLLNGINSLMSNSQPLVVLDGVIVDMQYGRSALHTGAVNNLLAAISTQDIESVEVLRNGTAIYGAKGAGGVILINTRRGRSLSTKIDFSAAYTFGQEPRLPEVMNASEYRTYVSELLGTVPNASRINEFKFLRDDPSYYYYNTYHNNTDWTREVYQESNTQAYNLNVQGGDEVAIYNLSIGYTDAGSNLIDNEMTRFNMRINSDVNITDRIKVQLDASYSDISRDLRDDGAPSSLNSGTITSPSFLSLIKSPFLSPYAYDNYGNISSFLSGADDYLNEVIGREASLANPSSILFYGEAENKNKLDNRLVTLGITPSIRLNHGLSITESFHFTMYNIEEGYYQPVTGVPPYEVKGVGWVNNMVASNSSHQYLTNNDLRIRWNKKVNGHNLDLTGGWRLDYNMYKLSGMRGYNSGNDKLPNMSSSLQYRTTYGINDNVTTLTYYLNGDYNWQGRLYANVGLSAEASSRFGKDASKLQIAGVPWGLFPSVSGSWVLSNEEWFKNVPAIDYLRVNLGWDLTGNDDIDLQASKTYFQAVNLFQQIDGTVIGNIGNNKLKWETTNRITFGADLNALNNRVSLSLAGFKSWTDDLITRQSLPYVIGISQNWLNGGALTNLGFTADLKAKLLCTRNWQWQLGASIGMYRNEVTRLSEGSFITESFGASILTEVGAPVGQFYGYRTNGVFSTSQEAAEADLFITDETGKRTYFKAGDMRFVDVNGDHEINDRDRQVIGNPNPDIFGNFSTRLAYRGIALDMVFTYALGNDIYNYQRSILESGSRFYNQTTAMRGRWSTEGQHASIPRISYEDPMGNARFSDRWIEDGSYLRLQNIMLSYKWDFDYRFLQGITLWGSASNLFTLTKYLGSDPEFSANNNVLNQGIDCGYLPMTRQFSVGVKINL